MNPWLPHVTVATVVEDRGRYLMVEEADKVTGALVFNQPAGHLERNESLAEAALRETLEETGWQIELVGILGLALHRVDSVDVTYVRTTFVGRPLVRRDPPVLDADIHAVHWLDYDAILANSARMRSPLVLAAIEQHRRGICFPLDLIYHR